jgi:hypothetical protein
MKNIILSICFASAIPPTMMFVFNTFYRKSTKKISESSSYETWALEILPPWEGKITLAKSLLPSSLGLASADLCQSILSVEGGGGRESLTWPSQAHNLIFPFNDQKGKYIDITCDKYVLPGIQHNTA